MLVGLAATFLTEVSAWGGQLGPEATPPVGDTADAPMMEGPAELPTNSAEMISPGGEKDPQRLAETKAEILELAKAKADTKQARQEAEDAETELARLKAGKLIRFGVTGGLAASLNFPLHSGKGAVSGTTYYSTPAMGALPYVMFHPKYWKNQPQVNIYCSNSYAGKRSVAAAQIAADSSAKERAIVRMYRLFDIIRSDPGWIAPIAHDTVADRTLLIRLGKLRVALVQAKRSIGNRAFNPQSYNDVCPDEKPGASDVKLDASGNVPYTSRCDNYRRLNSEFDAIRKRLSSKNVNRRISYSLNAKTYKVLASPDADHMVEELNSILESSVNRYPELHGLSPAQLATAQAIVRAEEEGETIKLSIADEELELSVEDAKDSLAGSMQSSVVNWPQDLPAKCGAHIFGFWVGYPLAYKSTLPVLSGIGTDLARIRLEVTGVAAIGLGISPNPYVSILAGVGFGLANISPADDDDELVLSFVFGIGGNLDLFTLLRG